MLISLQERKLCSTLRDFPRQFNNRYNQDVRKQLQQVLFHSLVRDEKKYLEVLFNNKVPRPDQDWSLKHAQGSTEGSEYTENARGKPCGHIFKSGEATYRCKTCTVDDTCVLCSKCFESSDHANHQVFVAISPGNSGCCDCGDPEAWKIPVICAIHSHRYAGDSGATRKQKESVRIPEQLGESIKMTIGRALDYMCDVISCSPEQLRLPKSEESIKEDEAASRFTSKWYTEGDEVEDKPEFALVLWNDEKHSMEEVQNQVARACKERRQFGMEKARETDDIGRSVVMYSRDLQQLLNAAIVIEKIKITVTIRSARDTFREQMCSTIIEWLLDIAGCAVGPDGDILKQTVCQEMLRPWRKGSRASNAYIGKDGIDDHEIDESMRDRDFFANRAIHDIQVQPNGAIAVTVIQQNRRGANDRDDEDDDQDDASQAQEGDGEDLMELDIDLGSSDIDPDGDLEMRPTGETEDEVALGTSEATRAGYPPPPPPPPARRNRHSVRTPSGDADILASNQTTPKAVVPVPKTPWSHNRPNYARPSPTYWVDRFDKMSNTKTPLPEDIRQRVRLDWMVLFDLRLWKKARIDLRDLYIGTVVTVPEFKRILGLRFAGLYTVLAQLYLIADREPDHSIIYLSLQMLTTPSITKEVVEKGNFLTNLIAILFTFLTTRQVGHPWDVNPYAMLAFETGSVTNRRMYHFFMDLKHLFQSEYVQEMLRADERYVLQFLDLVRLPQGICPNVRAVGEHVEYETDTWISASLLTRELNRLCRQFADAFKWNSGASHQSICKVTRIFARATIINSIGAERLALEQAEIKDETRFKNMSQAGFNLEKGGISTESEMYEIVDFVVESEPISFHHALHYTLSWLLDCAKSMTPEEVRNLLTFTMEDIRSQVPFAQYNHQIILPNYPPETYLVALYDFPLRVCAWLAQMKAGMWVRNGLSLRHQMTTYRGVQQRDLAHQRDIFLLQSAMVICNPSRMLLSIIDRFGVADWMVGRFTVREGFEDTQMIDVAEDFIHLLIVLLVERTSLLPPEEEPHPQGLAIRRDIAHILCFKPLSFSELCSRLADKFQDLDEFQEILDEMTNFRAPEGLSDSGTFELKAEYLAEIDPYILHYSKNQRDEAEAVYRNWVSKKTGKPVADVVMEPKIRPVKSGLFQDLGAFTRTDIFHQIILFSLRYALTAHINTPGIQPTRIETFLQVLLHLFLAAIQEDKVHNEEIDSTSHNSFVHRILYKGEQDANSVLMSLYGLLNREDLSGCHAKARMVLARLQQRRPRAFEDVAASRGLSVEHFGTDSPMPGSSEELGAKKKAALERQRKVMAQFQRQQQAFISNQNDIDWGVEDFEDEGAATVLEEHKKVWRYPGGNCILCQEETDDTRLYGTFGLLTESRILRQTDMDDADYIQEISDTPMSLDRSAEAIRPFGVGGKNHVTVRKLALDGTEIITERQILGKGFKASCCRPGPVSTGCGHIMHFNCFEAYCNATIRRQAHQIARNHPEKVDRKEFVCPLCKALGNTFLPIIWKGKEESYPGALETEVPFNEWINSHIGLLAGRYYKQSADYTGANTKQQEIFLQTIAATVVAPTTVAMAGGNSNEPGPASPLRAIMDFMPGGLPDDNGKPAAPLPEALLLEELKTIYTRLRETFKVNRISSQFTYDNIPEGDLVHSDVLATTLGYSISAVEIAQRGVESEPGSLLLEKIPSLTLTHLRVLSETASSYIAIGASRVPAGSIRPNEEFSRMQKRQLVQLFTGHPQMFEETPLSMITNLPVPAALSEDPFILLAEASIFLVPALRIDIQHIIQLYYLLEVVKVIVMVNRAPQESKIWALNDSLDEKSANVNDEALQPFVYFLEFIESSVDLPRKLSSAPAHVLKRLYAFVSTYALAFLRKSAILLHVRYGVTFPNAGYGDIAEPELNRLSKALRIPTLDQLFGFVNPVSQANGASMIQPVIVGWLYHWRFAAEQKFMAESTLRGLASSHPAIFELIGLPKFYDTLLDEMMHRRCPNTRKELVEPAICLFCGDIFCSQAVCCSVDNLGGCNQHMRKYVLF